VAYVFLEGVEDEEDGAGCDYVDVGEWVDDCVDYSGEERTGASDEEYHSCGDQ
jgi:hypothetical protein